MFQVTTKHKVTNKDFTLDLDTATLAELQNVADPNSLQGEGKKRFFLRKQHWEKEARLVIVNKHRARLNRIMEELTKRAIGPETDEVHKALKQKGVELNLIFTRWQDLAGKPKEFKEETLVNELRGPLQELKAHLADNLSGAEDHGKALKRARNEVGDVLSRAEAGVRAWVQGSAISYRGSLATGWRNAKKSDGGVAQRINVLAFDSDAFVEIPAAVWNEWLRMEIVTNMQAKGKMDLSELKMRAEAQKNKDKLQADEKQKRERAYQQLCGIEKVEEQLRLAMGTVKGYKKVKKNELDPGEADFSFVLQTSEKTERELTSGNLYPLEEMEKAGLPLTESDLDVEYESGVLKVKMPERHVRMSDKVPAKTYDWVPDSDPHTKDRPTVSMLIKKYFDAPVTLKPTTTTVTHLVEHLGL